MSDGASQLTLLIVIALALSACGGGTAEVTTDPTTAAVATPTPVGTPTTPTPAATATDGVKAGATVDIPASPAATTEAQPTSPPTATPTPEQLTGRPANDDLMQAGDDMGIGGEATYDSYTLITDDTGAIQVEVPTDWGDIDGAPYTDEQGRQLFDVRASSDLASFHDSWDTPGVIVTASRDLAQSADEVTLLDELVGPFSGVCTYLGRDAYDDGLYTGFIDVYDACGGTDTGYLILGAVPTSRAFVIRVQVQVVAERDLEALQRALQSFVIVGDV